MILGLTGAFGGGKSTVLQFFAQRNWYVFDADAVCRDIYAEMPAELETFLLTAFGKEVFNADRSLNRQLIAAATFDKPELMKELTSILYPLLTAKMHHAATLCRKNRKHGIFELPLLYEAGFENLFDRVLALWCDPAVRVERLKQRNYDAAEMRRRDARQLAPEAKLTKADYGVINNGSRELLMLQLEKIAAELENME